MSKWDFAPPYGGYYGSPKKGIKLKKAFRLVRELEQELKGKQEVKKDEVKKRTFSFLDMFIIVSFTSVFLGPIYSYAIISLTKSYITAMQAILK